MSEQPAKPGFNVTSVDAVNTLLLVVSAVAAFFFPFEVFLFSYAFFGPLHYLTEISWLEDRSFFVSSKKYVWTLVGIGTAVFVLYLGLFSNGYMVHAGLASLLLAGAFMSSILFIKPWTKSQRMVLFALIFAVLLATYLVQWWAVFFAILVPTIIHVSVFTLLFMFQGAQRSGSRIGYFNVLLYFLLTAALVIFTIEGRDYSLSAYITDAYRSFEGVNMQIMNLLNIGNPDIQWSIYESSAGLSIMRFIAFAYTYHYLNWFSKVNVIKWHKVSRRKAVFTILIWVAAVLVYLYSYSIGLVVLYFLSMMHVLLEFPLNHHSIVGIWSGFRRK